MKTGYANIEGYTIAGYESDYVFKTIQTNNDFYESTILKKWFPYLQSAKCIFDVGANLGNHTLYWAKYIDYEHIYAFEPYMPNFELLKKNIVDNSLNNISIVNKAVGSKQGYVGLLNFDEANYGGTTFSLEAESDENTVEIISIDEFVADYNVKNIDFIKIDTEGFELEVLQGFNQGIRQFYPDFWIEVSSQSFSSVISFLEPLGYVLVEIEGFNLLFLHSSRHNNLLKYEYNTALSSMFYYLDKTNLYYKNYEMAKKWVKDKDEQISMHLEKNQQIKLKLNNLNEKLAESNQKYKVALENYETAKTWIADKEKSIVFLKSQNNIEKEQLKKLSADFETEKNALQELINKLQTELNNLKQEYQNELITVYADYDLAVTVFDEANRKMHHLEVQNDYLQSENAQYRRKLAIITDSWWGKIGIKVYKKLKRIKSKLCK